MTDTTLDQARRCPKCEQLGAATGQVVDRRTKVTTHKFTCLNKRCRWHNETWVVDVRPDGTIPDPTKFRNKAYPAVPDLTNKVQDQLDRQLAGELTPGTEVRRY